MGKLIHNPIYNALEERLFQKRMSFKNLAESIGMNTSTMSTRMAETTDWKLSECYAILDELNVPYERLTEFFPDRRTAHKKLERR